MSEKILVVDDQMGIRMLLKELFSQEGYQCFQAANGKEALKIMREEKPPLVLLDMKIPGMDGLQILEAIRDLPAPASDAYVIMMTAYGEVDMMKEASQLGVETYFSKPFDIEKLRQTVNAWFRQFKVPSADAQSS